MKLYPSILGPEKLPTGMCYGFVKYDGSNLRCEWSKKAGWHKFGIRHGLLDPASPIFGPAVPLFLEKYGDDLVHVFTKDKAFRSVNEVTVFAEYFGSQSFSGMQFPDDRRDVVLFDVNPYKKGILGPKDFLDHFGHLAVAEVVYQGELTPEIVDDVRHERFDMSSKYEVRTEIPEGIVFKGGRGHQLWMRKTKTNRYKEQLKIRYGQDWLKYWE